MKRFIPVQNKMGMVAVKVAYPEKYLCKSIDLIAEMLLEYGDYKIVDFGLSTPKYNTNYLKFNTNLPWCVFDSK